MISREVPIARRFDSDEGLTMIEIVVSAVIFFFVLTAVLGLIGTTTMMGQSSKQRTVMVNALNAYVERVQALPFDQVDLVGTGVGVLSVEETHTVGEFSISIVPAVSIPTTLTSAADPSLKRVTIGMSVRRGATGELQTYTTSVLIRDKAQYLTQAVSTPGTDPTISFTSITPAEGAVVWGSSHAGGALSVGVNVAASDGRLVDQVSLWSDDQYILKDTLGANGAWQNIDQQTWNSPSFVWNTLQQEDVLQPDGVTYLPQSVIFDGMRTVSAYVIDSSGISKYTIRHMLVDNVAPERPARPAGSAQTNATSAITWPAAADGTLPAPSYRLYAWRQLPPVDAGDNPDSNWQHITPSPYPQSMEPVQSLTTVTFARYTTMVYAESPRGLTSSWSPIAIPWCSRPSIDGTYTVTDPTGNAASFTTSMLVASEPAFPTTSTVTYRWYRVASDGTSTLVGTTTGTVNTFTDVATGAKNSAPVVKYYATVSFTPVGYGAAEQGPQTLQTNTTTPTGTAAGTGYFDVGTW
ncbi:MAG: type IV pilus modification PilV family protein [Coriobacteriia bacterium]